jgi:hypothetical protein
VTLELNAKLAESFFLFWCQVAFDGTQKEFMAHLMKVSVREKIINRQVQTSDGVCFAPAFERLLDRNELIGESKSRNRMPFVNLKNDLPVFGIKHDGCEVRALRDTHPSRSALQGVAFAPRFTEAATPCLPNTLGDVWAYCLSKLFHVSELRELSAMRGFITATKRRSQRATVEGVI